MLCYLRPFLIVISNQITQVNLLTINKCWFLSCALFINFSQFLKKTIIMQPSSLGGGRILRRTVCPSVPLSLPWVTTFRQPLASRMYFSARTEGCISYGHLGRTNSCYIVRQHAPRCTKKFILAQFLNDYKT